MKYSLLLPTLVGIILVLMLGTSAVWAQDAVYQSKVTIQPTIELLKNNITKDDFSYKLIGQLNNTFDEEVYQVMITAVFFDEFGNLWSNCTSVEPSIVSPEMKVPFKMILDDDARYISSYDIRITWKGPGSNINVIENLQN